MASRRAKNFVWARLKDLQNDQPFLIVNTHLVAHSACRDARLEEITQLRSQLRNLLESNHWNIPVIIMGDFNAAPDSAPVALTESPWKPNATKPLTVRRGSNNTVTHVGHWASGSATPAKPSITSSGRRHG